MGAGRCQALSSGAGATASGAGGSGGGDVIGGDVAGSSIVDSSSLTMGASATGMASGVDASAGIKMVERAGGGDVLCGG